MEKKENIENYFLFIIISILKLFDQSLSDSSKSVTKKFMWC